MLEPKLIKLLSFYGDDIVARLQREMRINKSIATGKGIDSLGYNVRYKNGRVILDILGKNYLEVVDGGRGKGKKAPPIKRIEKWIKSKGSFRLRDNKGRFIPKNKKNIKRASFSIAQAIKKKGIVGTGMIEFVMKPTESKILADVVTLFVEEELNKMIRNKTI